MPQMAGLASTGGASIVLKSVHIEGQIDGFLATMATTQRYHNDSGKTLESIYTFPLPSGATLLSMDVSSSGKRLQATAIVRREAEDLYEQGIVNGEFPILLEQSAPGLYTVNLGNVKDGEHVTVVIRYAQLLRFEQGRFRLNIPTAIAQRYGDQHKQGRLAPHETADADIFAEYPLTIRIALTGQAAKGRAHCPVHNFGVWKTKKGSTVVAISKAAMDRDFVLLLEGVQKHSHALLAPDAGGCMMLAGFCPEIPFHAGPLALKVLADCSGSMAGDGIIQVRQALRHILREVTPQDYVSFSRFGSTVVHECASLVPCSDEELERLAESILVTRADMGGMEMESALRGAFSDMTMPEEGDSPSACVLLITGGATWNSEAAIQAALASGQPIFTVGVGSAPAEPLLQELADKTNGVCDIISPNEDIEAAIARIFRRMRGARVQSPRIDWGAEPGWQSPLPARLYGGDVIYAFAAFAQPPEQHPVLHWAVDGRKERLCAETIPHKCSDAVIRLGGARRMGEAATREEACELALRYQLVSEHSSLLLTHTSGLLKNAVLPVLHQVPQMLAAGHGGSGSLNAPRQPVFKINIPEARGLRLPIGMKPEELLHLFTMAAKECANDAVPLRVLFPFAAGTKLEREMLWASSCMRLRLEQAWALLLLWLEHRLPDSFSMPHQTLHLLREQLKTVNDAVQDSFMKDMDERFPDVSMKSWGRKPLWQKDL